MAITPVTVQYPSIAHGALNWDGGLRNDINALGAATNTIIGAGGVFQYSGNAVNVGGTGYLQSAVNRAANVVTVVFGFNPGGTLAIGGVIGYVPTGFRPSGNPIVCVCAQLAGSGWGGYVTLQINIDGSVTLSAATTPFANGQNIAGTCSYPLG